MSDPLSMSDSKPNIVYTVAFDAPETVGCRTLAKMLVSSLLRTFFTGDILIFRNTETPLFLVERKYLEEVFVETPAFHRQEGAENARCWKYRVREMVLNWMVERGGVEAWDKVMFLDADSLALRNIDHLLEGNWDVAYHPQRRYGLNAPQFNSFLTDAQCAEYAPRDGVNSGTLAVAAEKYDAVMRHWERIDSGPVAEGRERLCSDQGSWNRVLIESEAAGLRTRAFPEGEVQFPLFMEPAYLDYRKAALLHMVGGDTLEKIRFTFGLHMATFYCDPSALFLNILEM